MLEVAVMVIGTLAALGWVAFAVAAQRLAIERREGVSGRAFRRAVVELIEPARTEGGTVISPR